MSGYKRVNYYELCRLCTSTEGTKIHIFKEEGCRRQLPTKIKRCLPLKVFDYDLLPKMICDNCIARLEEIDNFRQLCVEAEKMLQDFQATLKNSNCDGEGKLQVYVKASKTQMIETKTSPLNESVRPNNGLKIINSDCEADHRVVSQGNVSNNGAEDSAHIPLQCTVPIKLNGTTSSVVPVSVENISSLMQVVPDDDMARIQQFKLPVQTEMAVVGEHNARYSVTLPTLDSVSKDTTNVIQTLQCAINDNGSINVHKMALQSAIATSTVPLNNSVAVSLISSPNGMLQNTKNNDVTQVNLTKDELTLRSCSHCGKILSSPNEVCNHTLVSSSTATISTGCEGTSTSVIQSIPKFSPKMAKQHLEEEGFKCDICEKSFRRKEHLFQHRKLHSGDRPYVCGSCGKSFSRKEHLFRHMLAHTGEKRHSCNYCGKTFSRKDNLHKHRKIHGVNGPYECELCGKSFIVQHYFLMHQANHSNMDADELPFQCDICKKGFVKEEFLKRHKVRHRVRNQPQIEETGITTINPVAILSPSLVQQNLCIEETVYVPAHPTADSITSTIVSNNTAATQTPFSSDLTVESHFPEHYRSLNSTIVSS